jgi:hypothetical protein
VINLFRDFLSDVFGLSALDVPETIPLKVLGLTPPVPARAVIVSAFRRRVVAAHPDLQHAFDNPVLQDAANSALEHHPEIRELVWARDVLLERVSEPVSGTARSSVQSTPRVPVTRQCRQCQRELGDAPYWQGWRCYDCCLARDRERAKQRRRQRRANRQCPRCAAIFTPSRSDGRYCSPRCRQAAFRARVTANRQSHDVTALSVTSRTTASPSRFEPGRVGR